MEYSLEKLLSITDIWEHIFQYFSLNEQLQLTQVCELFHYVISNHIWKRKYKELKLCLIDDDTVIVKDRVDEIELYNDTDPMYEFGYHDYKIIIDVNNRTSEVLDNKEVITFLAKTANNVIKLQIVEKENILCSLHSLFTYQFKQLKTLIVHSFDALTTSRIKTIKTFCPLIEKMILHHVSETPMNRGTLKDHKQVDEIASMKMLKTLFVKNETISYDVKDLLYIITKLQHLRQLILSINFTTNNYEDNAVLADITTINKEMNVCELLNIKFTYLSNTFAKHLLQNYEHLKVLELSTFYSPFRITQQFMENLIKSCKHLKSVCLKFCEFDVFLPLKSIETLTLVNCTNIKRCELKSILSAPNLRSFTSIFSIFSDSIEEPFYIASPLEYLHIETIEYDFRANLAKLLQYNSKNMINLKTLIWHDYTMWYDDGPLILHLPLRDAYNNLRSLVIDLNVVDFADIMNMENLKQLCLIENEFSVDLLDMLKVINHPALRTLKFYTRNLECNIMSPINDLPNYKTKLSHIQIPLDMFDKAQHLWMRLLSENTKLHIACYFYEANCIDIYKYIEDLFTCKKLPDRIKSIKINGITIDCNSIQENANTLKGLISGVQKYSRQFKEIMYFEF